MLKTFNVEEAIYTKFSNFCKGHGISMSKQIQFFMKSFVENEPVAKPDYIQKIEKIRKGKFVRVDNFAERYRL